MAIVAGVDFGTLSVRVTLVDTVRGRLGSGIAEYPLRRKKKEDPDYATQSHDDHMRALVEAMQRALSAANIAGDQVAALAIDTTGSNVIPVGENLQPLNEYYLWCDHRSWQEAALITRIAHDTLAANPKARPISKSLHEKHFFRKHGTSAYYGQK